jgi:predicted ATP-dependent endonuclease of OLD family
VSSDAEAAEAMVGSIERCCLEGVVGELLLIEEPEMMLTPQAARYLSSLLHRFADAGNQVVYSTWSPAFVDAVHAEEIVRLDLQPAGSVVRRARRAPLTEEQGLRITAEFDHERSEVFFARSVVLAEGRTERFALPLVFRQLGHDMDAEGIAMCEVGGKANLPPVVRVLTDLGIPCVVAYDTDGGRDADLDARVRAAAGEGWAVALDPDFEAVAGIGTRDEKVLAAWRRFSAARPEEIPEPLRRVVELAISPLT